jgi:hypothetical protein
VSRRSLVRTLGILLGHVFTLLGRTHARDRNRTCLTEHGTDTKWKEEEGAAGQEEGTSLRMF